MYYNNKRKKILSIAQFLSYFRHCLLSQHFNLQANNTKAILLIEKL